MIMVHAVSQATSCHILYVLVCVIESLVVCLSSVMCHVSTYMYGRFQPTDEEKEMYKKYVEDKTKLQNADTFLLKVR